MNSVLSHRKHILDLFSGSCFRQQCVESFHCVKNISCQIKIFGPFKEILPFS